MGQWAICRHPPALRPGDCHEQSLDTEVRLHTNFLPVPVLCSVTFLFFFVQEYSFATQESVDQPDQMGQLWQHLIFMSSRLNIICSMFKSFFKQKRRIFLYRALLDIKHFFYNKVSRLGRYRYRYIFNFFINFSHINF